jgi:Ca2+:H+ antiporter
MWTAKTYWISFLSGYLVNVIDGASKSWKMPVALINVILLQIVGNAAGHASAIMSAMEGKLDSSLGVAIEPSIQMAVFVTPLLCSGWLDHGKIHGFKPSTF